MNSRLVIVTGLSGAGKSIAIKALEDISFYCIDNLPIELVENAVDYFIRSKIGSGNLALGMDVRSSDFVEKFLALRIKLEKIIATETLFLTAADEVLTQRFSTTRRRHPMQDASGELVVAIRRERQSLKPIEGIADSAFDTSSWSPHQLARQIERQFSGKHQFRSLNVTLTSFGFKHGSIKAVDSIFDVRFLKNPHFDPKLKSKTGLDTEVREYVFSDPNTLKFVEHFMTLHEFLLPCYYAEGKNYFRIGIGCTGGQHRSVALAEHLSYSLAEAKIPHVYISVDHRDLLN